MIKNNERKSAGLVRRFFRKISDFLQSTFLGIHLSIRRKITFDFLTLYVFFTVISIVVVSLLFTYYHVDNLSTETNTNINRLLLAYDRGTFNLEALKDRLDNLSEGNNIEIGVEIKGPEQNQFVASRNFRLNQFPKSIFERAFYVLRYGYITKTPPRLNLQKDGVGRNDYIIYQIHSFEKHSRYTSVLILLMSIAASITFFFLSSIGGGRVKSVLSPIYKMTRTADRISGSNLEERIDVSSTKYELRDLAITINNMLDRLNKDYMRQKQFVSDVSHELRTPIAIINGYGNMVNRWGKEDEKILHEALDAILDEASNMQILVENLLTLARSDNQTLSFEYEIFNLSLLIEKTAEQAQMVDAGKQEIVVEVQPDIWVNLDFVKIKQVLRIFMDNAIKYTDEGKKIVAFCYVDEENVYAGIRDSGIGVEAEEIPRLFERFYRLDESRARVTGGHGLGLAIAKALVTGQGGFIRARSKKGVGSEFTIVFPKDSALMEEER